MTPLEERLVLELHSKWGNRWSRIARKLPGRTDNEIKNYWRTHMRKKAQEKKRKAQEKKRTLSPSSSLSNCSSSSSTSPQVDSMPITETKERSFYDTGGLNMLAAKGKKKSEHQEDQSEKGYSMDEIWKDIVLSEDDMIKPVCGGYCDPVCNFSCPSLESPMWEYCPDSLWMMDQEESKMFLPTSEQFHSFSGQDSAFLTG